MTAPEQPGSGRAPRAGLRNLGALYLGLSLIHIYADNILCAGRASLYRHRFIDRGIVAIGADDAVAKKKGFFVTAL